MKRRRVVTCKKSNHNQLPIGSCESSKVSLSWSNLTGVCHELLNLPGGREGYAQVGCSDTDTSVYHSI